MEKTILNKLDLEQKHQEIEEQLYNESVDFLSDTWSGYIDDSFSDYADTNTSIYYDEQRKFYNENADICEEALEEFGYTCETLGEALKNHGGTLDGLICFAGQLGEYEQIYRNLQEDKDEILQVALLQRLQKETYVIDKETLDEMLNEVCELQNWDELADFISDYLGA